MKEFSQGMLTKDRLMGLRKIWSEPDSRIGRIWEFDGIHNEPHSYKSYGFEFKEGLARFGCKTFDELVLNLAEKLKRKPYVVDLMGGAYFLASPEKANEFIGIRIHDIDYEYKSKVVLLNEIMLINDEYTSAVKRILNAKNRKIVEADILRNSGWKKIQKENLPAADLLVCRPVGPFDIMHCIATAYDDPKHYAGLYISLFGRMLGLVNNNGGIVFTEIPDIFTDEDVDYFFKHLDKTKKTQTKTYTVSGNDYKWSGYNRRYAVICF